MWLAGYRPAMTKLTVSSSAKFGSQNHRHLKRDVLRKFLEGSINAGPDGKRKVAEFGRLLIDDVHRLAENEICRVPRDLLHADLLHATASLKWWFIELMIGAVGGDGDEMLQHAPLGLRGCKEVVVEAVKANTENLRHASLELQAHTLTSASNLAMLLQQQGKLAEAEPLCRETLQVQRETLGDRHQDTLTSANNLAMLLRDQGKLVEAEPLMCRRPCGCSERRSATGTPSH